MIYKIYTNNTHTLVCKPCIVLYFIQGPPVFSILDAREDERVVTLLEQLRHGAEAVAPRGEHAQRVGAELHLRGLRGSFLGEC